MMNLSSSPQPTTLSGQNKQIKTPKGHKKGSNTVIGRALAQPGDGRLNLSMDVAQDNAPNHPIHKLNNSVTEVISPSPLKLETEKGQEKVQQSGNGTVNQLKEPSQAPNNLNLENLLQVEEKIQKLIDNLKASKLGEVSQLCSDWWELTDEEDYSLVKLEKVLKEDKLRKELRAAMALEVLCVAVCNYFTSAPELMRATHLQMNQVKNLLALFHQSFLNQVDLLLAKLPEEVLENQYATQLSTILKMKRIKKGNSKRGDYTILMRASNENLVNVLRNLARQGQAQGASM